LDNPETLMPLLMTWVYLTKALMFQDYPISPVMWGLVDL